MISVAGASNDRSLYIQNNKTNRALHLSDQGGRVHSSRSVAGSRDATYTECTRSEFEFSNPLKEELETLSMMMTTPPSPETLMVYT